MLCYFKLYQIVLNNIHDTFYTFGYVITCVVYHHCGLVGVCACLHQPYGWLPWLMACLGSGWGASWCNNSTPSVDPPQHHIYGGLSWQCNKDGNKKSSICLSQILQRYISHLPHKWQHHPHMTVTWPLSSTHCVILNRGYPQSFQIEGSATKDIHIHDWGWRWWFRWTSHQIKTNYILTQPALSMPGKSIEVGHFLALSYWRKAHG